MKQINPKAKGTPAHVSAAWGWIDRLRQDDVSQEELASWYEWYDADPRHRAAFDDMQALLKNMDRVTEGPNALSPELWLGELAELRGPGASRIPRAGWSGSFRRRRKALAAAAAVLVIMAITALVAFDPAVQEGPSAPPEIYTAANASSDAILSDGSHIELAAHTTLAVDMHGKQRTITMQEGVAFFKVAKDASKPFVVNVGAFSVRAVGTAFNIRRAGDRMVVTVAEGTIDVRPQNKEAHEAVRAHAGTEVAWMADATFPAVTSVNPERALGWKQGRLDYFNEPLQAVVADLNRYSHHRIVIADRAAGEIMVTATVSTQNVDTWIAALPDLFPVSISTADDGTISVADVNKEGT